MYMTSTGGGQRGRDGTGFVSVGGRGGAGRDGNGMDEGKADFSGSRPTPKSLLPYVSIYCLS